MDNSQQERKHQHLHGQAHRLEPDRRKTDIRPVEKCSCNHIHASPKKLPNIKPQKAVDTPQNMNILMVFLKPGSIFLSFNRQ